MCYYVGWVGWGCYNYYPLKYPEPPQPPHCSLFPWEITVPCPRHCPHKVAGAATRTFPLPWQPKQVVLLPFQTVVPCPRHWPQVTVVVLLFMGIKSYMCVLLCNFSSVLLFLTVLHFFKFLWLIILLLILVATLPKIGKRILYLGSREVLKRGSINNSCSNFIHSCSSFPHTIGISPHTSGYLTHRL